MIGKLTGTVDTLAEDHAILDVNGVGYLVSCPNSTLSKLSLGNSASLMIETRITDETIKLYGFSSAEEREWFRLLQTVQNVGARVALNVLSVLSPRDLERALALGDKAAVGRAQGVGPKLALRIVTELKDKAPAMMLRGHAEGTAAHTAPRGPEADAVAALVGLGYSPSQASEAVARTARDMGDGDVAVLIRESLRAIGRQGSNGPV
jgi:Holliday junction DNA helicase RuvA